MRFLRSYRLTARKQYLAVYGQGRRVGSRNLALFGMPNDVGHCRLGITATRKVGGAVRRNRVKRVLREVYRRNRALLNQSLDLVVNPYPQLHQCSYDEIEREFLDTFARLARRIR